MPKEVVISTPSVNKFGFRVLTEGIDVEQYKKNNILLFMHFRPYRGTKDEILAIGTVENIRIDGDRIIGTPVFDKNDEFARAIESKWESGVYKMVSAGLEPIEWSEDPNFMLPGQRYATLTKSKLEEISIADIGANDEAIRLKDSKGHFINLKDGVPPEFLKELKLIQKPQKSMKQIALRYGLDPESTEEQILAAIDAERAQNKTLKDESERQTLAAITSAVKLAVDQKRITEAQTNHFVELGKKVGIESLNVTLSAIEPALKPSDIITGKGAQNQKVELTDKKWADLNADERVQLRSENPEAYIKMYEAEYGFKPKL